MNITIISHNYYPEQSGIGLYSTGMAEYLAKNHTVTVITGFPYYPQWKIASDYKNKPLYTSETINNVTVYRFKQYTPAKPTFVKRILQMTHFFFGSVFNVLKTRKTDVIIVVMPFTISIILGWILKKIKGGKLWVHIQDFEFDAAFETGILSKKKGLAKILLYIEKRVINRADFTSSISHGMLKKLASKTNKPQYFFPNWIDHSLINPENSKTNSRFNPDKFSILYSGNIGEKQDWDFYIEFVKSFGNNPEFHFYLVGEGAKRVEVVQALENQKNCSYYPPVNYNQLNDLLCNADLHILFQKPAIADLVMPSKILGMMASARPSLITGNQNSEIKEVFETSQSGLYFYENDIEKIKRQILFLKENPKIASSMGLNARKYVVENYAVESVLSQFEKDLTQTSC